MISIQGEDKKIEKIDFALSEPQFEERVRKQ